MPNLPQYKISWPISDNNGNETQLLFSDHEDLQTIGGISSVDSIDFNNDGLDHPTWTLNDSAFLGEEIGLSLSPEFVDIDNDQDLEIIAGSTNSVISIDIKTIGTSELYWNIYSSNNNKVLCKNVIPNEKISDFSGLKLICLI